MLAFRAPDTTMANKIVRTQSSSNLVWLDLEMTGLDAQYDVILQAALIVTDKELQPLESYYVRDLAARA